MLMKRLYQSENNKQVAGVLGGLGEYFDVDATILRVLFVVILIFTAIVPCVLLYIVLALIMPKEHEVKDNGKENR
jgi:phage shock protein C